MFNQKIEIAQLDLDREEPKISINNIEQIQENSRIKMVVNVTERNLGNDVLNADEIEIYEDNQKVNLGIVVTPKDENKFQVEIINAPKGNKIDIKIKEGAFVDILGWRSKEYIKTL